MSERSFKVKGYNVTSEAMKDPARIELTIDGHKVQVEHDADRDRYSTTRMPYQDYGSLKDLAKSLIEHHPDFRKPGARK